MADSEGPSPSPAAQYWCYHCDKRVSIETLAGQPDVICNECKFGFVESLPAPTRSLSPTSHHGGRDDSTLGSQFLQVLRLLAQVAHEDDAPPPSPPPPARPLNPDEPAPADDDFLRIEIDSWDNDNHNGNGDNEGEADDDDGEDARSIEIERQSDEEQEQDEQEREDIRRSRRDVIRLRLRDFANRARSDRRNRILDWAEILMGLEDNSIEFRIELPETDRYIGNPGDYVDAAEYEALLQNLAEAEGRRGAPPAAKSAVENLRTVEITSQEESCVCAVCKDAVNVGDFAKEMPCGHGYHGACIIPWLGARNSCPVCRFELPTDDPEYEEERKKRGGGGSSSAGRAGNSSVAIV